MIDLLLNVSFGIFAFLPQGWLFMILIMLLESFVMSELLCKSKLNARITAVVFFSNFVSGLFGIITTMILNGGWWLVVWFPWVSSHEVDLSAPNALFVLIIFYLIAFVLSVLIEELINYSMLSKKYPARKILWTTLLANVASYLLGSIALYTLGFS
jgi:hypothetical protein